MNKQAAELVALHAAAARPRLDFNQQMDVIDSVLDPQFRRSNLPNIGQDTRVLAQVVVLLRTAMQLPVENG
jgi:hypothetical protein